MRRQFLLILAAAALLLGCAQVTDVQHSDYGYCARSVRHKHNDHVFLGDYHDHSLCEWERYN